MTIYEIKERTKKTEPYFFSRETMRFFNQTLEMFVVEKQPDGRYYISAPMRDDTGTLVGHTERFFNPVNDTLEMCDI